MKKYAKFVCIGIFALLSPFVLYNNFIYPMIPSKIISSVDLKPDLVKSTEMQVNGERKDNFMNYDEKVVKETFDYLKTLKLGPAIGNKSRDFYDMDYGYSYAFKDVKLSERESASYSIEIYVDKDDPSIIFVNHLFSDTKDKIGFYRIYNGKFDYEYLNKLINENTTVQ